MSSSEYGTEFGPTNVALHRVAIAVDLGDAGEALDVAREVDPSVLSPERQARFLVDVARAHTQRRQVAEATAAMLDAERIAPEQVQAHHLVRTTVDDLLELAGPRASGVLQDLATRIGVNG